MRIVTAACAAALGLLVIAVILQSDSQGPRTTLAEQKAQLKQLAAKKYAPKTKLQETDETDASSSGVSIKDLEREVKELEKQEKVHFAARAKALQKALQKAPKKEENTLKWKMAKDKYEQAAMTDIQKEENQRYNYTAEGESMFDEYAEKAQNLMGINEFNSLLNSTKTTENARAQKEEQTLTALRSASKQLRKIAQSERKLRELKEREKQAKINAAEQKQLKKSLAASHYGSSAHKKLEETSSASDAERQSKEAATLKAYADNKVDKMVARNDAESSREPYAADEAQAKSIETGRQKAFDKEVAKLREETNRERAARAKILEAEKKSEEKLLDQQKAEVAGLRHAEHPQESKEQKQNDLVHKQMKEALGGKKKVSKPAPVHLEGGSIMSSANYENSVAALLKDSMKRTLADREQRLKYHSARSKVLASDAQEASTFSGALAKTSDDILEPSQLSDLPSSDKTDKANVKRVVSARDREVDMIMGIK